MPRQIVSLADYRPKRRYDGKPWTSADLQGALSAEGPWSTAESFTFDDPDPDPANPKVRNFTAELVDTKTWVRIIFIDADGDTDTTDPVSLAEPLPELASVRDVRIRLGRELTSLQEEQVDLLIGLATANILAAVGKDSTWTPDAVMMPPLSGLCIEIVCRAMSNPQALGQYSQTLGAYSYTETYAREIPGSGLMLTKAEDLFVNRVVHGSNAGSAKARGHVDEVYEYRYGEDILTVSE
jgi:hypothetical protein